MSEIIERHHAGGKSFLMLPGVEGDAVFVGERREHRLSLTRHWHELRISGAKFALWCGMNPSTADAMVDDLTIRKEQQFTKLLKLTKMVKVNVGSYCCTDPAKLPSGALLSHPDNLPTIRRLAAEADVIVMATGEPPKPLMPFAHEVFDQLRKDRRQMMCLGTTNNGWPRHSSRTAYMTPFQEFK